MKVHSWGRLSSDEHQVVILKERHHAVQQIMQTPNGIAYGVGRSYGDVCLNPNGILWQTSQMNRLISFDEKTGKLVCEAGVLLRDIQKLMIPRGWILAVTPGTQLVTVGGAIANDVHGKGHHVYGSFGHHVTQLTLARTDGEIIICSPEHHAEWFAATIGGVGLTGVILQAEIQLQKIASPWLETEIVPFIDVKQFFQLSEQSKDWEYTVSWIDCSAGGYGRGLFMRGNSTDIQREPPKPARKLTVPIVPPISLINRLSLKIFNECYYRLKSRDTQKKIEYYEPFFYPLDNIMEWNRVYGPKGFFQYQSVIPQDVAEDATQAMLKEIARFGDGSFLAVLKKFGDIPSLGMLSFPQSGVTLALDFPNRGAKSEKLFNQLDAIVREAKGRLYLAKDARMPSEMFQRGYPRLQEFLKYRDTGISSALSRRLMGN